MAARNERREITALHYASNGQADPPHDGSRKRAREDDVVADGASRRRGGGISSPFTGMGRSNLQERRTGGGRTLKRDSSPSITSTDSRSNAVKAPLGYAAFGPRSGVLDEFEPPATVMHVPQSPRKPSSIQRSSPVISKGTSDRMDGLGKKSGTSEGEGEETFSLAAVLGAATIPPQTPERGGHRQGKPSSHGRSRSSPDPLNVIKNDEASHLVNTSRSANNASHPINVDDDEITDIDPPPTSRRLGSPKGTSIIQKGKVKQTTLMFEPKPSNSTVPSGSTSTPTRTEPNLDKFLVPSSTTQAPGTSAAGRKLIRSTPHALSGGPTSKGLPIPIGVTRPKAPEGKISRRMNGKAPASGKALVQGKAPTTGLKILEHPGSPPSSQRSAPRSKAQDTKAQKLTLQIQEWYCEPNHYESNASQGSYYLSFEGSKIEVIFHGRPGTEPKCLCLMKTDLEGFEVVDTAEDESYLWMMISLKERALSQTHWQNVGLGDNNRVLLHFLGSDDPDIHEQWKALIQGMAKWIQKSTIIKSAMDALIKRTTDRSSFHVPKVQDINDPALQRELKAESKAHMPLTKPRTRSAVSNSNQGNIEKDTKPMIIPDLDEVVLVHPTGTGSVTINRGELARLEPGEFLNDTLIELGLKMWLNDLRLNDPTLVEQIHVFSSFFFKKLDAGRGKGCDYNSVKKWTSKFNLFSKKFIIIPINEHLHWYLAIICFPEHVLEAPLPQPQPQPTRVTRSSDAAVKAEPRMSSESDMQVDKTPLVDADAGSPTVLGTMEVDTELASQSEKMAIDTTTPPESQPSVIDVDPRPNDPPIVDVIDDQGGVKNTLQGERSDKTWILILDSLGGKHNRTVRILREYLQAEAQERCGKVVEIKDARSSGGLVEDKHLSVPVQPNWCDCGIYLLHYVEVFYANPLEIIGLPPGSKRKTKEAVSRYDELWKTDQVKNKRTVFREKLHELSAKWLESKHESSKHATPTPGTLPLNKATDLTPLPRLQVDESILEIDPFETKDTPAATTTDPSSMPSALQLLGYPDSPSTTIKDPEGASSDADDQAVEGIVHSANPPTETSPTTEISQAIEVSSSSQSSPSSKTRRGKKGGAKHGPKHGSESPTESNPDPEDSPELKLAPESSPEL